MYTCDRISNQNFIRFFVEISKNLISKEIGLRSVFFVSCMFLWNLSHAQITGYAFRDYNGNGTQQGGEPGRDGIIVKFYSNAGLPTKDTYLGSTTTNSTGNYSFNPPVYPVRIEFEIPSGLCNISPSQDFSGANGGNYGTAVQFAFGPSKHDFVVSYPYDFSTEVNPYSFIAIMGSGDPLDPNGNSKDQPAIGRFNYLNSGYAANSGRGQNSGHPYTVCARHEQVGSTWGLAYSRHAKKVWVSSCVRRHSGIGPLGSGGIYWFDAEGPYNLSANLKFINFDELGIPTSDQVNPYTKALTVNSPCSNKVFFSPVLGSNTDRGLSNDKADPSADPAAWSQVGKLSFGDMDISEDGRYLYIVNLYDKKLYEIDLVDPFNPQAPTIVNVGTRVRSFVIPDPCGGDAQPGGQSRPWALKYSRGRVLVGVTCSAQKANGDPTGGDAADMLGTLYELEASSGTWSSPILQFNFDYRTATSQPWVPWRTDWWFKGGDSDGCPLISDIEFDAKGNIIIGVMDMHASQLGHKNANLCGSCCPEDARMVGDILQAVRNTNSPSCQYSIKFSPEYYNDNNVHLESSMGALSVHFTADFDGTLSTFMDPVGIWSSGTMLFNNLNGAQQKTLNANNVLEEGYEVIYASPNNQGPFGKANSLGDIETVEIIPPIEIGNLLWLDRDEDGIQDGDELGIPGITIELLDVNGNLIASTVTDSKGGYYFNYTNVVDTIGPLKDNVLGPQVNTDYMLRISPTQFSGGVGLGPIASYTLTPTNQVGAGLTDYSDNDASLVGGLAKINIKTKGPGENDHTFDFGLIGCAKPICHPVNLIKN